MKLSKELKAGIIVIIAIAAFVVLFQFMKGKNIFSSDNVFYVEYDDVDGLNRSSPVSINGLKVGKVDDITPITSKDGHIRFVVRANIDKQFQFSKESLVEIYAPGLMQDKALRIDLVYTGPQAKNGDTLRGILKPSALAKVTDQLGPVSERLTSVLARVDTLAISTNQLLDVQNRMEIRRLLNNLNETSSAFRITAEQSTKFLNSNQERLNNVLDNTNKTMLSANKAVQSYGKVADEIDIKKLNDMIGKLDVASSNLNQVIAGMQNGKGSLGKLMNDDELYMNLNHSAKSLEDLILDLKAHPNRYVNFSVFGKATK